VDSAVDETQRAIEYPANVINRPAQIVPGLDQLQGVVRLDDGLLLIQNLEKCLSLDEARALDEVLQEVVPHEP